MRGAGDGFLRPDLFVLPEDSGTRLLWHSDRAPWDGRPVRFLTRGEAVLASGEVRNALGAFVDSVIERLVECGVEPTRLSEEWAGVQEADAEEAAYCMAAARLGLDPYSEAAKFEAEVVRASDELGSDLLEEFLGSGAPERCPFTGWRPCGMWLRCDWLG